jgi:ankyrin repeat protein
LHLACSSNNHKAIEELLTTHKLDPNDENTYKNTPLHLFIKGCEDNTYDFPEKDVETIKKMISHGANINHKNQQGETPLSLALSLASKQVKETNHRGMHIVPALLTLPEPHQK